MVMMNFSFCMIVNDVYSLFMDVLDKCTKDTVGLFVGKRLLCFVDDLNMFVVDKYGM